MKLLISLLIFISFIYSLSATAGKYTPEGLQNVESHRLANGLEVFLKERHEARSTSIRLVVNYGSDDNECGKRETAHYLEHLLFTGTSKHTEEELDKLIEDNGGSWNAFTYDELTIYEIDIYAPYTDLALDVLYEITTDSTISEENVKTTLDIINREAGGKYSWLSRFLYDLDIGKTGYDKGNAVLYSEEELCPIIESFEDISRDDIITAFEKFYVPNNMALIIVGDFNSADTLSTINKTFGNILPKETDYARPSGAYSYEPQDIFTGTLSPLRGNDADVYIRYRIPGLEPKEAVTFALLSVYLTDSMYKTIRIDKGLSYSVDASAIQYQNYGRLELYADSEIENMQLITDLMLEEVDKLISSPIPLERFNRVKRGLLLSYVSAFQDNASIATTYSVSWPSMLTMDGFMLPDEIIETITPEDVHELAVKYMSRDRAIISHDSPTLSYEQTYILIGLLILLCAYYIKQRITLHKNRRKP